jgi:hypothetical protein
MAAHRDLNYSAPWHDGIDGEFLVCGPNGDESYRATCTYIIYVLGPAFYLLAALDLETLRRFKVQSTQEREVTIETALATRGDMSSVPQTVKSKTKVRWSKAKVSDVVVAQASQQETLDHYNKRQLELMGFGLLSCATLLVVVGNGTMYSSRSTMGRVGDFLMAINYLIATRLSMVMCEATAWFESLLHRNRHMRHTSRCSPERTLNFLQGVVAPGIVFVLWGLLYNEQITRTLMYNVIHVLISCNGIRTVGSFLLQSLPSLKRIASIQNTKKRAETQEARDNLRRKRRSLRQNAAHLATYVVSNALFAVLHPLLYVFLGSFNSSRQLATHTAAGMSITWFGMLGAVLAVAAVVRETKARVRIARATLQKSMANGSVMSSCQQISEL